MKNNSNFYFKLYSKNILTLISLAFITFFSFIHSPHLKTSLSEYIGYNSYSLIVAIIITSIMSTYISGEIFEFFDFIEFDLFKKYSSILLAGLKFSTILLLPIIFIIFINLNKIPFSKFQINGIIHLFILWYSSTFFSICLGTLLGAIFKNRIRYFIIFILISPFIFIFNNETIFSFIRILDDKTSIIFNPIGDILLNKYYILDKFFIIVLIFFMISILYSLAKSRRRFIITTLSLITILLEISILIIGYNSINTISDASIFIDTSTSYSIDNYSMKLDLSNKLINTCEIDISNFSPSDTLVFNLDEAFDINYISINDNNVNYTLNNNLLTLDTSNLNHSSFTITINYDGYIYGVSDINVDVIYTTSLSTSLLDQFISWYPKPTIESAIHYELDILSKSIVYSNLNSTDITFNNHLYNQKLSSKTKSINIISGNYKTFTYNDIEIIAPIIFEEEPIYSNVLNILNDFDLNETDKYKLNNGKIERIILTPFNSNLYPIIDNTIFFSFFIN